MKKIFTLNLFLVFVLFLGTGLRAQEIEERTEQREFKAEDNALIDIDSKFGQVEILSWEKSIIEVSARMWVESSEKEAAREILDNLNVELAQEGNRIIVKSIFPEKTYYGKKTKVHIDFKIRAPKNVNLDLKSKYGYVFLDENSGHVKINLKHGNIKIGSLERGKAKPVNEINLAYSDGNIDEMNWAKLQLSYSKINIGEAHAIVLISKYSGFNIEDCSSFVVDSKYDNFRVDKLVNFNGEMKYSKVKINELNKNLEFSGAYSSLSVNELQKNFNSVRINTAYGSVKIGLDRETSFSFLGTAVHGDIYVQNLEVTSKKVDGSSKYIQGFKAKADKSTIEVSTRHADVNIYEK